MALTSGHLSNNAGVRGHSAGGFYPYLVVIVGDSEHKYHVVAPSGKTVVIYNSAAGACRYAELLRDTYC